MADPDIPKLVKELRECYGLPHKQLAISTGVTYRSMNHMQDGRHRPQPFPVVCLNEIAEEPKADSKTLLNRRSVE